MTESAADIVKYLDIVEGKLPQNKTSDNLEVDLGVSTRGVSVGSVYIFDNGLCWAKVIGEKDNHWIVEHGLLEHAIEDTICISKHDMTDMIRIGEMTPGLLEDQNEIIAESITVDIKDLELKEFLEKANRYLLVNEGRETDDFEYDWKEAFNQGLSPIEAIEEAGFLEEKN